MRPGAAVADLTEYIDTADWPEGTRLIVRREPRHPGAQRSLFRSDNWRYWGHWTDRGGSAVDCDAHMRAHAVVEDHIAALKTAGLLRLPFADFDANAAWVALICWARSLVVWFQQLACTTTAFAGAGRPNASAGPSGTPPGASPAAGAERPSAYPPTTPPHRTSPASTTTSPPSTDTGGEATKTPQPPPQTTRRANHTRPHTNHTPQTTPPPDPKPTIKHPTSTQHPAQRPQQEPNHPPNHSHEQSGLDVQPTRASGLAGVDPGDAPMADPLGPPI